MTGVVPDATVTGVVLGVMTGVVLGVTVMTGVVLGVMVMGVVLGVTVMTGVVLGVMVMGVVLRVMVMGVVLGVMTGVVAVLTTDVGTDAAPALLARGEAEVNVARPGPLETISTTSGSKPGPDTKREQVVSLSNMEFLRSDLAEIAVYKPGRPIEEVARELGFDPDSLVKVASNENPYQPLEEVVEVMARAVSGVNRYPDNEAYDLRTALSAYLGVALRTCGAERGSSELIRLTALAVGGPGREAVFGWPSFAMYPLCVRYAMMTPGDGPAHRRSSFGPRRHPLCDRPRHRFGLHMQSQQPFRLLSRRGRDLPADRRDS